MKSFPWRFVRNGKPKESVLSLEYTEELDAQALADVIHSSLVKYGLEPKNILSQCYDGANVMRGCHGGVQRILQDIIGKRIPYTHCFNHQLHLIIIKLLEIIDLVRHFFDQQRVIYSFFKKTRVKRVYQGKAVQRLIETRWSGHARANSAFLNSYEQIVETLPKIRPGSEILFDGEEVTLAKGILHTMLSKEFVFLLHFMADFLALLMLADKMLQSREMGYREAMPVLQTTMKSIEKLRTSEKYESYIKKADDLLNKVNATTIQSEYQPRPIRNRRRSSVLRDFAVMSTIGEIAPIENDPYGHIKSCFFEVIDVTVAEFNRRFNEHSDLLIAISTVSEMDSEKLAPLKELGIVIPNDSELMLAKANMDMKRDIIQQHNNKIDVEIENAITKNKEEFDSFKSQKEKEKKEFNLLGESYSMRSAFGETYNLVAAVDCFACSTAVCEASFSAVSRVGIVNRISMTNKRLRHLSYLAFEYKRLDTVLPETVLRTFNNKAERRVQLY